MKRLFALALALMMVFALAACGGSGEEPADAPQQDSGEQDAAALINPSEEAWVSSETGIAYIFSDGGYYASYSLVDGVWKSNGDGSFTADGETLTIDSTPYQYAVTDGKLVFTVNEKDYTYERTSPFTLKQAEGAELDQSLVLADGQAWVWTNDVGVPSGYVFNQDGTYGYYATDEWTLQSSGEWSTSGDSLVLISNGERRFTYAVEGAGLTMSDIFGDVYGPYSAQSIPGQSGGSDSVADFLAVYGLTEQDVTPEYFLEFGDVTVEAQTKPGEVDSSAYLVIRADPEKTQDEQRAAWFEQLYTALQALSDDGKLHTNALTIGTEDDAEATLEALFTNPLWERLPGAMWSYPCKLLGSDVTLDVASSYNVESGEFQLGFIVFES